jgi:hypothetical protein
MLLVRFGLLLVVTSLIVIGLPQARAFEEAPVELQSWGSLCDSPGETQSCLQSCRGTFDPVKDYGGYQMCLEECKRRCRSAKDSWPLL